VSVRAAIDGVSVKLGSVQALDGVTLVVEPGTFVALLGPSGCGKTTTLNVLAGFVRPDVGVVSFDGEDVTGVAPHRRDLGIVFQGYALFPHMSVADNVGFPLRMRRVARAQRGAKVHEALALVGLEEHARRSVATLSGGQRQRVALARAIVFEPRMLLLDEPLAALDKQLRDSMQLELRRLQQRLGITAVAVTHDQVEALTMADVVAVMRDGRIEQIGAPAEVYARPATTFVATFLGEANLVRVDSGELAGFGRIGGSATGQAVIRPEHATVHRDEAPDGAGLTAAASIEEVSFQGARLRARARLLSAPDTLLTITQPTGAVELSLQPGDRVTLQVDRRDLHVIPDAAAHIAGEARPLETAPDRRVAER